MNIKELYELYKTHYLVDTDTRKVRENSIFFALKGDNFNGNTFAEDALKKGAKYSVVDEKEYKTSENIILVDNVLNTLQQLATYHRKQLNIPIIALTGSNGKTTTKELINAVLSEKHVTTATVGNLNNHIGVPLTLLSITPKTEIGIIEMGANHPKEIGILCDIAMPDYGYITNFGKAHLEGFGSLEGVIEAKSELYTFLENNNKTVFVNSLDTIQVEKTKKLKRVFLDETIELKEVNPFVKVIYKNEVIATNLIGNYNFANISAAITIGNYFNVSSKEIKKAIEGYFPKNNRSQIIHTEKNSIVLDAYNANPTSMRAALENFNLLTTEKDKIVILGDMFELGNQSLEEHQFIANFCTSLNFQNIFLVGENFYKTTGKVKKFKTFLEFEYFIKENPIENHSILVKGSRGMSLERVLEFIN